MVIVWRHTQANHGQDGVVSERYGGNARKDPHAYSLCAIARIFSERPFLSRCVGEDFCFDNNLCMRRNQQIVALTFDQFNGLLVHAP